VLAGLWGVIVTDAFQFVVAMAGSILLAVLAVDWIGGLDTLVEQSAQHYGSVENAFGVIPPTDQAWLPLSTLLTFLAVQWWAAWYPGAEPGGGGYVVQRILSAKDERHGLLATLWFNIAHYALRPWPWILVGFVGALRYPGLANPEEGYVRVMVDVLPSPFKGLMLAAFAAAYMSTIATQMNWGASYIVNDFYRRFLNRGRSERHYVFASRVATFITVVLSIAVTYFMNRITGGWELVLMLGAGTGLVYILRWYWWRINAWSEIAAMSAALIVSIGLQWTEVFEAGTPLGFSQTMLTTVGVTTVVWLVATFVTAPEPEARLIDFYRRVHPAGPGWAAVAARAGAVPTPPSERLGPGFVNWILGIAVVYSTLFGIGQMLFGEWPTALACVAVATIGGALLGRRLDTGTPTPQGSPGKRDL
jgi:Na+/proline symporter